MKIAFVGKGGGGKTTYSALFSEYLAKHGRDVTLIDADLNIHLPVIMGATDGIPLSNHLSQPGPAADIRAYLKGDNRSIETLGHFKKTTPPGRGSNFIRLDDTGDYVLQKYSIQLGSIRLLAVGTYEEDEIGTSCYHNNLAILENMLSHMDDGKGVLVADMVAGVDAFSNTLHAQFDMLVLSVEPTMRGLEVYRQYQKLAEAADVADRLFVVGNKVADAEDEAFIRETIPAEQYLGSLSVSKHLGRVDKGMTSVSIDELEDENKTVLAKIAVTLEQRPADQADRLKRLHDLHRVYVAQASVKERFGDLLPQIDENFAYPGTRNHASVS